MFSCGLPQEALEECWCALLWGVVSNRRMRPESCIQSDGSQGKTTFEIDGRRAVDRLRSGEADARRNPPGRVRWIQIEMTLRPSMEVAAECIMSERVLAVTTAQEAWACAPEPPLRGPAVELRTEQDGGNPRGDQPGKRTAIPNVAIHAATW